MTPVPNNMRRESFFHSLRPCLYEETGALLFEILFILILRQYLFHLRIPIIPQAHHLFAHLPTIQIGLFSFRFHLISELSFHFTEICRLFLINFRSAIIFHNVVPDHLLFAPRLPSWAKTETELIKRTKHNPITFFIN